VLLYRNADLRRYQYFNYPDWPGGIYMTPGLSGSRSGGVVAATWAAMVSLGERGYLDAAARIFETAARIRAGIEAIPELEVIGEPTFLVAFRARELNIYHVNDHLISKGWRLNSLQLPPALHFCVTRPNTAAGVAEAFVSDLGDAVEYAKHPARTEPKSGALYGLGGTPAGDEILDTLFTAALDAMYEVAPTDARG
jgi:sphinganine-1-phosphate aldolase